MRWFFYHACNPTATDKLFDSSLQKISWATKNPFPMVIFI